MALLSLLSRNVLAAGPLPTSPVRQDTTTERYADDLVGQDVSDRLYAARVLLRRVRTAWRVAGRKGDALQTIEARQTLANFDQLVAPRCIRQLAVRNVRIPCTQILGMLETKEAVPALQQVTLASLSSREHRIVLRTIRRIEGVQ